MSRVRMCMRLCVTLFINRYQIYMKFYMKSGLKKLGKISQHLFFVFFTVFIVYTLAKNYQKLVFLTQSDQN